MKVLMISGDKSLLLPESDAGKRLALQRAQVEQLDVIVWPQVHSWREAVHLVRKNRYDVVTAQDPFFRGMFAWKLTWFTHARLQVQVHADLRAQSLLRRLLARFVLSRADSVRVVSKKVESQVRKIGRETKIHILPLYVDLARFQHLERIAHERPAILWIGRFENEKGPLLAIEVLKQVRAQGIDAVLVMLGAGKLEAALRKAAKQLPVEFPGWKLPEEYLRVADVVLCTSPYESWGASIIEALSAGIPVVAPDVGIAREAGAIVVSRSGLAEGVVKVLREKPQGALQIGFLDKEEWSRRWKDSLA